MKERKIGLPFIWIPLSPQEFNNVTPPNILMWYQALMAASYPPVSPVEKQHQQSVSKMNQESLINLLIVPPRNKDRCCSRRGDKRKNEQPLRSRFNRKIKEIPPLCGDSYMVQPFK